MLELTSDLCLLQQNGRTALMEAVRSNMVDMAKVLVFASDDRTLWKRKKATDVHLTARDSDGKSVVHHCVKSREVCNISVETLKTSKEMMNFFKGRLSH